jgi:opacity protein-like surface antigen
MFRKILLASVAVFGSTSMVLSADLPVKAPPVVTVIDDYNWAGFYLGAFVGGAWGETGDFDFVAGTRTKVEPHGIFAGVHAGYDMQLPNRVVLGVRVAAPFGASLEDSVTSPVIATASAKGELEWAVLFTGHVGLAMGRWLPYVGGGLAVAEGKGTFTSPAGTVSTSTNTHTGFTALAGLRYGFSPNWWGAIQYNYTDLGSEDYVFGAATRSIDFKSHSITGMLSYRFGGPVVARY